MKIKKILKYFVLSFISLIGLIVVVSSALYLTADMKQPVIDMNTLPDYPLIKTDSLRTYGPDRKSVV